MYFTKSISAFIVGALMATSAVGELTQVPRRADGGMLAREEAKPIRSLTREEKMQKRADDCLSAIQNKRLRARADKNINVDAWDHGKDQDTLTTTGLATCYGVAITGSYEGDNSGDDRFLSHTLEGERGPAEALFDAVEAARGNGLGNIYALLVYPDPSSFTDENGWTDEDRTDIQAEHDWYVMWIADATGGVAPEEKSHSYMESWGIKVNSFKGIQSGRFVG
ncbi:hypothetical protein E0Z10_g7151 [Xylaria hypoxylon]|uniref:Uncharacterized protein n=1 Tax=Xylaria hypoxylon TaxID=37992 RepID=A0A4Z0YEK8_9PEZI|nr:hypothetical protein E0Z10_g7151 [Xylaria hypoxylon]